MLPFAFTKITFDSLQVGLLISSVFLRSLCVCSLKFGSDKIVYYYNLFSGCGNCQGKLLRSVYFQSVMSV